MTHRPLAALAAFAAFALALSGCYTVRTSAPPGSATTFAADGEACAEISSRRVHYAIAGLVPLNSNQILVPPNSRVRVVSETDVVDTILRGLGIAFTLGLYGGSQSARVEVCQAPYIAGAPGGGPVYPAYPYPAPPPPPPGPQINVQIDPAAVIQAAGAMRGRGGGGGGGGGRVPVRDTDQAMCSSSLDCDSGVWCRDRGDGVKLCMGDGSNGDFCGNGTDCGSGLFCRQGGDGFKRCM